WFGKTVSLLAERAATLEPQVIVAIESRGFIFGGALAAAMGIGMVPVRKPGKLPYQRSRVEYALEYGVDALEMHSDALLPGCRVVVVDDLLATGGTAKAAIKLTEQQGARVAGCLFVVELSFLGGREKLGEYRIESLIGY
ncbi:MAG: adenine phosphoribosyltransferase, partial [Pseudomonadota bacterium]